MGDSGVRLSEVLVSLSLATDLGFGQPAEHMLRAARISMRLGARLGLDVDQLATLYDVGILTYVGCPVYGNEAATLFGDDIAFRGAALRVDLAGTAALRLMLSRAGHGTSAVKRVRTAAGLMATAGRQMAEQMANHCSAAGLLAERLGLGDGVRAGVEQAYARWDGRGVPADLRGDDLSLAARIAHVAEACELFHRTGGRDHALDMVRRRSGTQFDPEVASAVLVDTEGLFAGPADDNVDEFLDAEPVTRPPMSDSELDAALAAIGDFCDLRCPYFAGHSATCGELVGDAAKLVGLDPVEAVVAHRAALVHDVGRFGVPGSVWDRPGPLSTRERERMRLHVYFVERIFSRPEPLRRIGLLAATHHERLDGSGYHRAVGATMLSQGARLLAVVDAYSAMLQPRPHRGPMTEADAAAELRREAGQGRLDRPAVDAVLEAAGHGRSRARSGGPAGLTARESDVLALLAQGLPNKAIARQLGITTKTVGNHVEHIYAKLGVSNRASAAMRAMQHGVIPIPGPAGGRGGHER